MKHTLLYIIFLLIVSSALSQAPQAISYQAVARNSSGNVLDSAILNNVKITLRNSSNVVYTENHSNVITNKFGLFSLEIGKGDTINGSIPFSSVDWGASQLALSISIDNDFISTVPLLSVPYALYAENAGNAKDPYWEKTNFSIQNNFTSGISYNKPFPHGIVSIGKDTNSAALGKLHILSSQQYGAGIYLDYTAKDIFNNTGGLYVSTKGTGSVGGKGSFSGAFYYSSGANPHDTSVAVLANNAGKSMFSAGIYATSDNQKANYVFNAGISANATGNGNNFAGYFGKGKVQIENQLMVGTKDTNFVPISSLNVQGHITMKDGYEKDGYIPVSNAEGTMTWTAPDDVLDSKEFWYTDSILSVPAPNTIFSKKNVIINSIPDPLKNDLTLGLEVPSGSNGASLRIGPAAGVSQFPLIGGVVLKNTDNFELEIEGTLVPKDPYNFGLFSSGPHNLGSDTKRWGEIHANNGLIQTSDRNKKEQIQPIEYGLSSVMKLNPVSYYWKDKKMGDKKMLGIIAQELEKIIKEPINKHTTKEGKETYGVNYQQLIPVLIKAIQEQQEKINALEDTVNQLTQQKK